MRPLSFFTEHIHTVMQAPVCQNTVHIVAGSHRSLPSYAKSIDYLRALQEHICHLGFRTTLRLGGSPDADFALLLHSARFLATGGAYGRLIEKTRNWQQGIAWGDRGARVGEGV